MAAGFKLGQYLYLGGGIAVRSWTYDPQPSAVNHYFIDSRGYFAKTENSFYYRLRLGYAQPADPTSIEFANFTESEGGVFVSPGLGIRLVEDRTLNLNLEMGFQHAKLKYDIERFNQQNSFRTYKFNRLYFQVSMMFQ